MLQEQRNPKGRWESAPRRRRAGGTGLRRRRSLRGGLWLCRRRLSPHRPVPLRGARPHSAEGNLSSGTDPSTGNRTPRTVSVARAPPDQHLGAVSRALRDIGAPGEEQRSPGLPSRGRQTGSTAPKRPSPSPGVPCRSGTLLGSSAGGTAGINRTGLGKKKTLVTNIPQNAAARSSRTRPLS